MITPAGNFVCDHCKKDEGEFATETGNHEACELLMASLMAFNEIRDHKHLHAKNPELNSTYKIAAAIERYFQIQEPT